MGGAPRAWGEQGWGCWWLEEPSERPAWEWLRSPLPAPPAGTRAPRSRRSVQGLPEAPAAMQSPGLARSNVWLAGEQELDRGGDGTPSAPPAPQAVSPAVPSAVRVMERAQEAAPAAMPKPAAAGRGERFCSQLQAHRNIGGAGGACPGRVRFPPAAADRGRIWGQGCWGEDAGRHLGLG